MATPAAELDIPEIGFDEGTFEQRMAMRAALPDDVWLVRNLIGYGVLRYEDAVGILREEAERGRIEGEAVELLARRQLWRGIIGGA